MASLVSCLNIFGNCMKRILPRCSVSFGKHLATFRPPRNGLLPSCKSPLPCHNQARTFLTSQIKRNIENLACSDAQGTGLVLGVYCDPKDPHNKSFILTPTGEKYNKIVDGKLLEQLIISGPTPLKNEVRLFYGLEPKFPSVAVVGLGQECLGYNEVEQLDESKERIREAAAAGSTALQTIAKCEHVFLESFGHAESAAEGAAMGVWEYQEHRTKGRLVIPKLHLFDDCDLTGWQIGLHKAAAQNLSRQLCEAPPNLLTPRTFSEHTVKLLNTSGINIEMKIKSWLKMVGMDTLLAIGKGSCEDPVLLEATYYGCDPDVCPVVLIGKGVTFDSGGLCLKGYRQMEPMRCDMAGAACVIATLRAASALQLPLNIRALIPMCENMLGPRAMKPGDIVRTMNGKTVRVKDTDVDGRLAVIDILSYAATYKPKFVLDIGTLSKGTKDCLGTAASGIFTNNDQLWEQMRAASIHTGDKVWRMPLWRHFRKRVTKCQTADVCESNTNVGAACLGAAFLNQFLCGGDWIHMDIYGVVRSGLIPKPYMRYGMTGRPTRTLIEFLAQFSCQPEEPKKPKRRMKKKKKQQQRPQCKAVKTNECRNIK